MSFLEDAADAVSDTYNTAMSGFGQKFLASENTRRALTDAAQDLANTIDRTAQQSYIMNGFSNADKTKINNRKIVTQAPQLTVLVKKKYISSLAENYKMDFMNKDERHFMEATNQLFENKCKEIAAYERITKLNELISLTGYINNPIVDMVNNVLESVESDNMFGSVGSGKFYDAIKSNRALVSKLRSAFNMNQPATTTEWIRHNGGKSYSGRFGGELKTSGTGVIELTIVNSLSSTVTRELGGGSCGFDCQDPYRMMFISEEDIERAMFQTAGTRFSIINVLADMLEEENQYLKNELAAMRASRGVSQVTYRLNVATSFYNRLSIIVDDLGIEITAPDGSGLNFDILNLNPRVNSKQRFTKDEQVLLKKIYKNTFKVLASRAHDYQNFRNYNYEVGDVRRMMRLQFLSKQIIQAMDTVTVFVNSNTRVDDSVLAGLGQTINSFASIGTSAFAANGLMDAFSKASRAMKGAKDALNPKADSEFKLIAEKNLATSPEFPLWLYKTMKQSLGNQDYGTCIFCGVVTEVKSAYSDGSYTVRVDCKDNSYYLSQGWIQETPGVEQFNGFLYDPVTPFDFSFNKVNGLVPSVSGLNLLAENNARIANGTIRYGDGSKAGQIVTSQNFNEPDVEETQGISRKNGGFEGLATMIYDVPEGFVYKWKSGIGTAVINQSGTSDSIMTSKLLRENIALVPTKDPFGGQDLVNVISMLVTGQPYNFNTFIRAAMAFGVAGGTTFTPDTDYFLSIFNVIRKQNKLWGDFIPFKRLTTDPKIYGKALDLQLSAFAKNSEISKLQTERTKLLNQLIQIEGNSKPFNAAILDANTAKGNTIEVLSIANEARLVEKIIQLDAKIKINQDLIRSALTSSDIGKRIISVGSNFFFDQRGDDYQNGGDVLKFTMAEQNEITKRTAWQVKSNTDQNLFIVGSEYDADYDIQALSANIAGKFEYMNLSWQKIDQKINAANSTLGFEIFANTQGHIEVRVPHYNRMPSSVMFDMLKRKQLYNIQIYPSFLQELFSSKLETAIDQIELLEDQIRLHVIALGAKSDADAVTYLDGSISASSEFIFVTGNDGRLTGIRNAKKALEDMLKPKEDQKTWLKHEPLFELEDEVIVDFFDRNPDDSVQAFRRAAKSVNNFDSIRQSENFNSLYGSFTTNLNFISEQSGISNVIRARIGKKLGMDLDSVTTIEKLLPNSKNGKLSPVDVNDLQTKLEGLLTQRYNALSSAMNMIRNYNDAAVIDSDPSGMLLKAMYPGLYGQDSVPEFIRDMIEDETYDDFGPGSGNRFVIREHQIKSMNFWETPPAFTSIEVSGTELGGIASGQGGFSLDKGKATLSTAWAVDYDMWRIYGFRGGSDDRHLSNFNDAETQLAPFAVNELNKERAKIFTANITMNGDENIQPGEVYFVESQGMLYYSKSVGHTFTYGSNFTTSVDFDFGHLPGEYIPTSLDIIGKNVYQSRHANMGNHRVSRSGTTASRGGTHLGTLIFDNKDSENPGKELINMGFYSSRNRETISNIVAKCRMLLPNTATEENKEFTGLTVRVYSNTDEANQELYQGAMFAISTLREYGIPSAKIIGGISHENNYSIGIPMVVNRMKEGTVRNVSDQARNLAKDSLSSLAVTQEGMEQFTGDPNSDDATVEAAIIRRVIDIWLEDKLVTNQQIVDEIQKQAGPSTSAYSDILENFSENVSIVQR